MNGKREPDDETYTDAVILALKIVQKLGALYTKKCLHGDVDLPIKP